MFGYEWFIGDVLPY